jgi:hypothetical protein
VDSGVREITVVFERREDGGLRAYSDDVPGFLLSHSDAELLLGDVQPALEGILSHIQGKPVRAVLIGDLREELQHVGVIDPASAAQHLSRTEKSYLALAVCS